MSVINNIKRRLGLESIEEKLQRFEEIRKSFEESDQQLDELAKDFYIEKSMYEARMKEPDNYIIQSKIQEKFDVFLKGHKESIRKAKKQFDSLKKEKDEIEKAFSNHKYIRKEPDGKGGWNYVYEEGKNESKIEDWKVLDIDSIIQEYSDYGLEINQISYSDRDVFASYKNNNLLIGRKLTSKGDLYKVAKEDKLVTERVREKMNPTQSYKTILAYSDNEDDAFNLIVHHELGHAILEKLSNKNFYNTKLKSVSEIRDELLSTLKKEAWNISIYAGKQHPLLHSSEEGFAESWALYKVKPELLKEKFPNIFNVIHKLDTLLIGDLNKSILGEFGDQCIATIEGALKNKKETAYEKIKKAYQHGQISLDSFNTIIKGLTKEEKTKYADFLLFNEEGKLLLLKRSSWEDDNAGAWVVPGGHVDPGEDFKTAAIRELQEESGYNVDDAENVGSYEDDKCHIEYFQAYINTSEKPLLLQFSEVRDYKWISVNEICEEAMVFNMRDNVMKVLGIEDQDKHKKIIRKAILTGIIPIELVIQKAKDIKESSFYQNNQDKYKQKLERLEARRTDKQYTKEEADYVDNWTTQETQCEFCSYWRKDSCIKVIGEIRSEGHCKFFEHPETEKGEKDTPSKAYLLGLIPDELIEKAWKKQPIGTVTTRKDGQQYRKVAETGNTDQDWKLVSKDKAESGKPESEGNKESKEVKGGDKPIDSKELEIHAKNASESTLQSAIKESADANVRTAAHNELDRRETEEKVSEKKDGGEKRKESSKVSPQDKFAKETGKDWVKESVNNLPGLYTDKYDLKSGKLESISLDKLKPTQEGEDRVNASSKAEAEVMQQFLDGEIEVNDVRKEDFYPIVVDADTMKILDGNHRFSAYEMLGLKKVNIVMLQPKEKEQIKKGYEQYL